MQGRGEHQITSSNSSGYSTGASLGTSSESGIGEVFTAIFWMFFLTIMLAKCAAALAPSNVESAPTKPAVKIALFESKQQQSNIKQLSIALGGGSYEIEYKTSDSDRDFYSHKAPPNTVYVANFETGSTAGNLETASLVVLIGNINLKIGAIAGNDSLYADIISRKNEINAYFNFATSERGPPTEPNRGKRKRVIVVGTLDVISFNAASDRSLRSINLLELDPSNREQVAYEASLSKYEYRKEEIRREQIVKQGTTHGKSFHK